LRAYCGGERRAKDWGITTACISKKHHIFGYVYLHLKRYHNKQKPKGKGQVGHKEIMADG